MSDRLKYPRVAPRPYQVMTELGHYLTTETALSPVLLELVKLRASRLNGCDFCIGMHTAELRKHNEPETRIEALKDWRNCDAFTPTEQAALAWTDALTHINGHVPDDIYDAAKAHFNDKELVDLSWAIAQINAWNRMGVAFASEWRPPQR